MKTLKLSVLAIASIAAMVSCSSENDIINEVDPNESSVAIKFGQSIGIYTKAPFTGTALANDTKVGLWANEYAGDSYSWAVTNKADNATLTVGTGGLSFTAGEELYYSKIAGTKYDFYAYTPLAETATNGLTVNAAGAGKAPTIGITLKAAPADQVDVMYATPITGAVAKEEAQSLVFNHALAQVKFTIAKEAAVTLDKLTAISVETKSTGTMSISDGAITTTSGSVTMTPLTAGDITLSESAASVGDAIMVFPEAGVLSNVTFTIDGKDYTINNLTATLTKNKITTIAITVEATGISFTQSVNAWENEAGGTGTI